MLWTILGDSDHQLEEVWWLVARGHCFALMNYGQIGDKLEFKIIFGDFGGYFLIVFWILKFFEMFLSHPIRLVLQFS